MSERILSQGPARVALIGANGYGLQHRRHLAELADLGVAELVGLADPASISDLPPGVPVFTDHRDLLDRVKAEIVIVSTPPHTHLDLGSDVLRAGADLLLEKPPVLDLAQHAALVAAQAATGRVVQVGFQALASPALARLRQEIAAGTLGIPRGVSVLGAWRRDDAYWSRSAWSGRRTVHGRPSLDGALANPFAHALMQALAVLDADPVRVDVAWSRLRPVEVEDTATLRVTLSDGSLVLVAVTLAGEEHIDGELVVRGSAGRAELEFREDLLKLPGQSAPSLIEGRRSLLENLIAHRRSGEALLAPLAATARFTRVIEALRSAPEPVEIEADYFTIAGGHRTLRGVNAALRRCADEFALLTEIEVPWSATDTGGTANSSP